MRPSIGGPILEQLNDDDVDEFRISTDLYPYYAHTNKIDESSEVRILQHWIIYAPQNIVTISPTDCPNRWGSQ